MGFAANRISTAGWPPQHELIARHRKGEAWWTIADSLGVSRNTLRRYMEGEDYECLVEDPRVTAVACNIKFEKQMKRAIASGKEKAPIGIYVDNSPLAVRIGFVGSVSSGCGSPAASCCD